MLFYLKLLKHLRETRAAMTLLALGSAFALCSPVAVLAQSKTYCGPEVKEEVARALASVEDASDSDKLAMEAQLYEKFQGCAQDSQLTHRPRASTWPRASAVPPCPTSAASSTRR